MKIFLSPAKLMNTETPANWNLSTSPKFLNQAEEIMDILKDFSSKDLQNIMKISSDLAELNVERNHNWKSKPSKKEGIQAALAFNGEAYRGLNAESLNQEEIKYLSDNLFILSGLYGALKPTDKIMPYRLEMGTKLDVNGSKNLYNFWKNALTEYINSQLKKDEIILNLASNEYFKALNAKELKGKIIDVEFKDFKNGKLSKIMVYFKHARGAMTRYCATNKVSSLDELKLYDADGYNFDENSSTETNLVFIR